jgi:hypothetical protein
MFARWAALFDFSDTLKSFSYVISFDSFSARTSSENSQDDGIRAFHD